MFTASASSVIGVPDHVHGSMKRQKRCDIGSMPQMKTIVRSQSLFSMRYFAIRTRVSSTRCGSKSRASFSISGVPSSLNLSSRWSISDTSFSVGTIGRISFRSSRG